MEIFCYSMANNFIRAALGKRKPDLNYREVGIAIGMQRFGGMHNLNESV